MDPSTATDELWRTKPETIRRFLELRPNHEKLCEEIAYILRRNVTVADIEYSAITSRAKSLNSFCEKFLRKTYEDVLGEVTDIAGVRIVYLYESDRSKIEAIVEREFHVLEKVDNIKQGGPEHFGYGALHYLIKLSERSIGARYDDLKDLVCEIQVRTILQDAWAVIAHHLSYKKESDVPEELRRKLNALSGLFETADDQFDRLRDERAGYSKKIQAEISSEADTSLKKEINLDNLTEYLKWRFSDREQGTRDDVASLLEDIQSLKYKTLEDVDSVVSRVEDAMKAYEKKYPPTDKETNKHVPFAAVGALRTSLRFSNPEIQKKLGFSDRAIQQAGEFLGLVKPKAARKSKLS